MNQSENCIEISNLRKTYNQGRVCALDGVDLSVAAGEIFGLIGPNGAGKSTLMGCLLGLLHPDYGSVLIVGKPANYLSVRQMTGYVPERPDFEQWMTARQLLVYHHMLARQDATTRDQDVEEALDLVELSLEVRKRRLGTFSRGMLQRLSLAQLLIGKPKILLLDEPTLGLDPPGVAIVRKLVAGWRNSGLTAIINSHQLDEVERECDRVAFMRHGKIESIEDLRGSVVRPYVLFVRWSENHSNGQNLSSVAESIGATINEKNRCWAKFSVANGEGAARLIQAMVSAGYPVEEAVNEKSRLEELFHSSGGSGADK